MKFGARHDIADDEGFTPLHFAALRGNIEVALYLLEIGANPYIRNKKGFVPYEISSREDIRVYFMVCG